MIQGELLAYAVLAFAERTDPSSDCGHMLADAQVYALHERRVDLPAAGRQHLLDRLQRAKDDAVAHPDHTAAPHGLAPLRIEELGPGHPAGLRRGTGALGPAW